MPEITWFGWLHTGVAIAGILAGIYSLATSGEINATQRAGKFYLVCTVFAAVSALMIYRHGGFGPAHALAVLTLLAVAGGLLIGWITPLSKIAPYFRAFCFTGTLLFHMVPAVTDALLRLPPHDPFLAQPDDPLLLQLYLALVAAFFIGYAFQFRWLLKRSL